ncbi:MAG: hypothetical protein LJF04_14410 [Gemmatimonadetes bacterium]|nr:hypothetical protein [Gemmatimonadota bacterium]
MSSNQSFWFRLGYALERARRTPSRATRRLTSLKERERESTARSVANRRGRPAQRPVSDDLIAAGAAALAAKALDAWRPLRGTGPLRLLKAGVAGAAAALLVDLVRPLLRGTAELPVLDGSTVDRLLAGAAQGVLYAGVVEPRVPGPALVKGTLYGSTEYIADPAGGLSRLLGSQSPLRRIPVMNHLVEDLDPHDRVYLEHVTFGIALALLYGSSPLSNGIAPDDEE